MYDTFFAKTKLLHAVRALPGPHNTKDLMQFQLFYLQSACGIIMDVESKEAALAGGHSLSCRLFFAFDNAKAN